MYRYSVIVVTILFLSCCIKKDTFDNEVLTVTPEVELIDTLVNCDNLSSILEEVYSSDQANRSHGIECFDKKVDTDNLRLVISIIENCQPASGSFSRDEIGVIWLVLQHSDLKYATEYFDLLVDHTNFGLLDRLSLLMMLDRILLSRGAPQEYGTQVCKDKDTGEWDLCKPYNLDSIKMNRAEAGFMPIEEYVEHWGIVFED